MRVKRSTEAAVKERAKMEWVCVLCGKGWNWLMRRFRSRLRKQRRWLSFCLKKRINLNYQPRRKHRGSWWNIRQVCPWSNLIQRKEISIILCNLDYIFLLSFLCGIKNFVWNGIKKGYNCYITNTYASWYLYKNN